MGIIKVSSSKLPPEKTHGESRIYRLVLYSLAVVALLGIYAKNNNLWPLNTSCGVRFSPYGQFPRANDPFNFLPCTKDTLPPPLNDTDPRKTWSKLFDPDPDHWSWGNVTSNVLRSSSDNDPHANHGIYLCGYLDVPLDYTNSSDERVARLSVTKYQVSGLARIDNHDYNIGRGQKSERTLIIQPGGPGGSGSSYVWRGGTQATERLSSGKYDVFGWDPRGVNASLPRAACVPFDADRDRWSLLTNQYRASLSTSPENQLQVADSYNNATMAACKEMLGDVPRFLGTAFVARDLDLILTALNEREITGYFVSYGTGIGQTFANMFPHRVGRLIMDGTEYQRDHRLQGGFGWTALDNGTDAWNDGFLGECVEAGPKHCALAIPPDDGTQNVTLSNLQSRMSKLLASLALRPMAAFTKRSGPSLITYSQVVGAIYQAMYNARSWPGMAQALHELEQSNTTRMAKMLEDSDWEFSPPAPCPVSRRTPASTDELGTLVICADSYDAPKPWSNTVRGEQDEVEDDLEWWSALWKNMTAQSWVAGNSRFYTVLPCRHYNHYFGPAAEVYRGDLNHTLKSPALLIAETYDPATPLRNGRRLLREMGDNARLVVHHGYGHSSRDTSACTDKIAKAYILYGTVPESSETDCYADEKPYRYSNMSSSATTDPEDGDLRLWYDHKLEMREYHW